MLLHCFEKNVIDRAADSVTLIKGSHGVLKSDVVIRTACTNVVGHFPPRHSAAIPLHILQLESNILSPQRARHSSSRSVTRKGDVAEERGLDLKGCQRA